MDGEYSCLSQNKTSAMIFLFVFRLLPLTFSSCVLFFSRSIWAVFIYWMRRASSNKIKQKKERKNWITSLVYYFSSLSFSIINCYSVVFQTMWIFSSISFVFHRRHLWHIWNSSSRIRSTSRNSLFIIELFFFFLFWCIVGLIWWCDNQ